MIAAVKPEAKQNNIVYHWGSDHMIVLLGNRIPARIKMLFWAEFLFTFGMTTILMAQAFWLENTVAYMLTLIASGSLYMMAAYRFLSRMFYSEKLLLDNASLTIVKRTLFRQDTAVYEWGKMGIVHYAGKSDKTDHPLKGKCYDYFGFETQEHLIQRLHQDGNLSFTYMGKNIRFAKDVYSWDAEKMIDMMKLYAGSNFRLGPEWANMQQAHEWGDL